MARKKRYQNKTRYQSGGYIVGNPHSRGGVKARIVNGNELVELEGHEYIIQGKAVDKYGIETIAKINQMKIPPEKLRNLQNGGSLYGGDVIRIDLHTSGGEYTCEDNSYAGCNMGANGTYIGPMHYHPDKGYMAGSKHSNKRHPLLIPMGNIEKMHNGGPLYRKSRRR